LKGFEKKGARGRRNFFLEKFLLPRNIIISN